MSNIISKYILPLSLFVCTQLQAQTLKIGTYEFKDGAQYNGEIKAKPCSKTETPMKVNT